MSFLAYAGDAIAAFSPPISFKNAMTTRRIVIWSSLAAAAAAAGGAGLIGVFVARIRRTFADTFDVDVSRIMGAEDEWLRDLL